MPDQDIPLYSPLLTNIDETLLDNEAAAIENCYINDNGGLSRFPRLNTFVDLAGGSPTYLLKYNNDLHAVSGGYMYRINIENQTATNLTKASISGGGRVIYADTGTELHLAAGDDIIKLSGEETEKLSDTAPKTTHVVNTSGYSIGIEKDSGRFRHSENGNYRVWNYLDTFSAEGKSDNLVAAIVTKFGELMLAGTDSIEQFDASPSANQPFFKRWGLGEGLLEEAKYTLLSAGNRLWGISSDREFVSFSSQISNPDSEPIQQTLQNFDDVSESWTQEIFIQGKRFILLQFPNATNSYGTTGVTYLYDYRNNRWTNLYSWDEKLGLPKRWEGWSFEKIGNRVFVGGNGKVYELSGNTGDVSRQQMLWRSGHFTRKHMREFYVGEVILRLKRGVGAVEGVKPKISLRANKNNRGFGKWIHKSIGLTGDNEMRLRFPSFGNCDSIQFEMRITDDADVQIKSLTFDRKDLV